MKNRFSRREFLAKSIAAAGVFSMMPLSDFLLDAGMKKPNIVLIMADDMGYSDLGCFGSEIETPNIDGLAKEGLKFTQFYNCARCCPTRASLLTGLYPHRAGMGSMVNRKNQPRPPAYQGFLNDQSVTIAEAVQQAGYHTLMSGKWHVGEHRPHWPLNRGFERYYGLISGASSYFDTSFVLPGTDKVRIMVNDNQEIVENGDGFYMTNAIAEHTVEMIKNYANNDRPFFLYTAFTAPHWPLHALKEDIEKYRDKFLEGWDVLREKRRERMISLGLIDEKWGLSERDKRVSPWQRAEHKKWEAMRMAVYAAQIDRMDQGIGKILAELKRTGVDENTLIFFLSDNGGCAEILPGNSPEIMPGGPDSYMSYGIAWANASNTPFRRYKKWVHEGGISTPLIARWKGVIKPNTMTQQMGHVIDLMPTILDVAGAKYPKKFKGKKIHKSDGKSLLPVLKGKTRQGHEALYWEHLGNRAVRQGKWKLVMDGELKSWELYDLEDDRTERKNLIEKYPKLAKQLRASWQKWAVDVKVFPKKL